MAPAGEAVADDSAALKLGTPLTFGPKGSLPEAAVIWLHGFGDGPRGWTQALAPLRKAAPSGWAWRHLRAPPLPQPCYRGRKLPGWGCFNSQACIRPGSEDCEATDAGYEAAVAAVHAEVEALERDGLPPGRILIGGFSQGAAVALHSACSFPRCLAGCVALSGWLSRGAREQLRSAKAKDFPCLLCHGTKDDMVGFECGEAAAKLLREAGASVQFERLEGIGHSSCRQELQALAAFFQKVFRSAAGKPEMREPEWVEDDSDSDCITSDISYVSKRSLDKLRGQLASGADIAAGDLSGLENLDELPEEEVLVSVRLGALGAFACLGDMVRDLGPQGAAQAFVKAADAVGKDLSEGERPPQITVKEWREMEDSELLSEDASGLLAEEGEEEEPKEGDEVVEPAADPEEGAPEPVAKRRKSG